MINKIKKYYQVFGFKETIKKIFRYANYNFKTKYSDNGVYKLSKKELRDVKLKNKKIYLFAKNSFGDLKENSTIYNLVKDLNSVGYSVYYIYVNDDGGKNNIFAGYHKSIKKFCIDKFEITENDIVLFENAYGEYFDFINYFFEKKSIIYFLNNYLSKKEYTRDNKKVLLKLIECSSSIFILNNELKDFFKDKILGFKLKKKIYLYKNYLDIIGDEENRKCLSKFYDNISVVILNYNNKKVIQKCLNTLLKYNDNYNYEIIVVDNQSSDGSYEMLKEKYPEIKLYRNNKNGCSSGRNLGVSKATKEYVIFLDSDQWILNSHWLNNYLKVLENESIGAVGWAAGWFDKNGYAYNVVDNFEYRYMPPMCLYRKDIGYLGTGGLMMRRSLFNDINGFDEAYDPTCYEDTDLSLNIRNSGKEIVYCPYLGVGHLPHQTTKSGSKEHDNLIKEKGNYFVNKWMKKNKDLLKYIK